MGWRFIEHNKSDIDSMRYWLNSAGILNMIVSDVMIVYDFRVENVEVMNWHQYLIKVS